MNSLELTNVLSNAAITASFVLVPLFASELGISYFELGVIGASFWLGSVISYYVFGWLSDVTGEKSKLVKAGYLVAGVFFLAQMLVYDFTSFTAARFLAGFTIGIYTYPVIVLAASVKEYRKEIGSISAYGSLGSFFGAAAAAFLGWRELFAASAAMFFLAFAVAMLKLPHSATPKVKVPLLPMALVRKNFKVYFAYFLRHFGANAFWIVYVIYLAQLGAEQATIAAIAALNPLCQFFFMKKLGEMAEKKQVGEKMLIRLGAVASALVFAAFLVIPNYYFAFPVAVLIAASWSLLYVGSMVQLAGSNVEKTTATSILGSVLSLATVLGLLAGGAIAQAFGIKATLVFALGLTVASLVATRDV